MKSIVSEFLLCMLLTGALLSALNLIPVMAEGAIYIRADGSIDPSGAPILTSDGITYTFKESIHTYSIIVERDNITIDGEGFSLVGSNEYNSTGLDLIGRRSIVIRNMNIRNFFRGLLAEASFNIIISSSNFTANSLVGIVIASSSYISISGNNVTGNGFEGVRLDFCSNSNVSDNYITDNLAHGVALYESRGINILMNNVINNKHGVEVLPSCSVNIVGNNITSTDRSGGIGIYSQSFDPRFYSNITARENRIMDYAFAIYLENARNAVICYNNLTRDDYGVSLDASDGTISANTIEENVIAIFIFRSSGARILNNELTDNSAGVCLNYFSSCNEISGNNITRNEQGISSFESVNNSIHHNNFINNVQHAKIDPGINFFDDGYPSGGNFWSGFSDSDVRNGQNQDIAGGDGIWDHPYYVDTDNMDRFPLTKRLPWDDHDISIVNMTSPAILNRGVPLQIDLTLFNYGFDTETFNISIYLNLTQVYSLANVTVTSRNSKAITYMQDTTRLSDNYIVTAYVWPVTGEKDTADNARETEVYVATTCDINGDGIIDILDIVALATAFGSYFEDPRWNALADINSDGFVNILDIVLVATHYGRTS